MTRQGDNTYTCVVWRVRTAQPATVDAVATVSDQPATTAPISPSIATTTAGDFVIAAAIDASVIAGLAVGDPFVEDTLTNINGWVHLVDPVAPRSSYLAQWTATSGAYASDAVAFAVLP